MFSYFNNKKIKIENAEQAVMRYILACKNADEKFTKWCNAQPDITFEIECGGYNLKRNSIQLECKIPELFNEMKSLVNKCPRKFRNDMATRLFINGYSGV